ncbi:MAG: hypothetical protein OJF62_000970 [Pseudolabrys sp.]|nr:hypothetical protein [Pseudolabrys sp.]
MSGRFSPKYGSPPGLKLFEAEVAQAHNLSIKRLLAGRRLIDCDASHIAMLR